MKSYKELAIELVDELIKRDKYGHSRSALDHIQCGFENATHCINDLEDKRGYWELVYVSIQSNLDEAV
jgi:hypothetical protein